MLDESETIMQHQNPMTGLQDRLRIKLGGWNYARGCVPRHYLVIIEQQDENLDQILHEIEMLTPTAADFMTVLVQNAQFLGNSQLWKSHSFLNMKFQTCVLNLWTTEVPNLINRLFCVMYDDTEKLYSGTKIWDPKKIV